MILQARRDGNTVEANWVLGAGSAPPGASKKPQFTLPKLPEGTTAVDLIASANSGPRRVRIEVVRGGPLVIGHQTGTAAGSPSVVSMAGFSEAPVARVVDTFEAAGFHLSGDQHSASAEAELAPPNVTVPSPRSSSRCRLRTPGRSLPRRPSRRRHFAHLGALEDVA